MSRVAIVGAGTAGLAAAALLARAGHDVEVLERAPDPGPVGAGLLLQPTGMRVLERLGVLEEVRAGAARVDRVVGTTIRGKRFMDFAYADLRPGLHGLGVHRGALFTALRGAAERAGARLRAGVEVREPPSGYDHVVGADGARSAMRRHLDAPARVYEHPWGALWAILPDPAGTFDGTLSQYFDGARRMAGFLPTGAGAVSLFWSVRLDRLPDGEDLRRDLLALAPHAEGLIQALTAPTVASYRQVSLRRWHAGPLVLVGDAAHALSPQLGHGANLALLDAEALADAFPDFAAYQRARRSQATFYAFAARALNLVFQNDRDVFALPRDHLMGPANRIPPVKRLLLRILSGEVLV